ncbi:hypothetical protein TNCV_2533391 [Trichonephila clavipes]|nr:hypothetical protein TNCV_2533391 [Trichonephila clavipes]
MNLEIRLVVGIALCEEPHVGDVGRAPLRLCRRPAKLDHLFTRSPAVREDLQEVLIAVVGTVQLEVLEVQVQL